MIKKIPKLKELNELVNKFEWNRALEKIWDFIKDCNAYVALTEPWKADEERKAAILYTLVEMLRLISLLVYPVIPAAAENIAKQINSKITSFKDFEFKKNKKIKVNKPKILFQKLELEKEEDPFSALNLKVALVEDVSDHPGSDKLYVLKIDLGTEKRTLVAGLAQHYKAEELKGKKIVILANLEPRKLRGIESQGMLLAAVDGDTVSILTPDKDLPNGAKIE